jgi:DNA repair protein RecO (recombination protein O)
MGLHSADAIVLRRYPFRETSVTLSCLTDRFGKLKGLIKGLRAQPNRYHSAMEPFTINRIVFYDTLTSQLHLISQCHLLAPLMELQRNLATAQAAAVCVELSDVVLPLEEPQPAVYHLLQQTLQRLAVGAGDLATVQLHFIARLLRLSGFQPQVDACTGCDQPVQTHGHWSARQGGLICPRCLHLDPAAEAVSPAVLQSLNALATAEEPPTLEAGLLPTLQRRLEAFLRWQLDHPLKALWSPPAAARAGGSGA